MISPFFNDGFSMIWKAFENLFPEIKNKVDCQIVPFLDKVDDGEVYGLTEYFKDEDVYQVSISAELRILDGMEVFAHELAHCAAGMDNAHNEVWAKAFDDLFDEYNRLGEVMFDKQDKVEVMDGKAYVREKEWKNIEENYLTKDK